MVHVVVVSQNRCIVQAYLLRVIERRQEGTGKEDREHTRERGRQAEEETEAAQGESQAELEVVVEVVVEEEQ
jgi:hypothetical protein